MICIPRILNKYNIIRKVMSMEYMDKYKEWLSSPIIDDDTRKELESIKDDKVEIEDRFFKDLEFGTGGLRGVIGAGSNRMNIYTVGKATQGLANYIKKQGVKAVEQGVAIAYDSRRMSKEFAEHAALVLNANGIKTYVYGELQPTPVLSFTVRELKTTAGIVITASHNPPQYNGYKVYWSDGGQIPPERASEIIGEVDSISNFNDIKRMSKDEAREKGLFNIVDQKVLDKYVEKVKELCINRDLVAQVGKDMKIIYTPLHGTGNKPVRRILKELGFEHVEVVPEQEMPDPNFSTVSYPNPEDRDAFNLAIEKAKKEGADLILGTDPDCDRVGVVVKDNRGEYIVLSGNQTGSLLVNYYLGAMHRQDNLPSNGKVIKTIVTSELGREVAKSYGIDTIDTLTGFKFIGEKIHEFEQNGDNVFLFGYEESYGYLAGDFVRDKDAVIASMLICEMAAYYKSKGMTLYDGLEALWGKYGCYLEELKSVSLAGKEGMEKIKSTMDNLRNNVPESIDGVEVAVVEDYLKGEAVDILGGNRKNIELPKSNVLKFIMKDDSWFAVRPSGTEPKIKFYFSVIEDNLDSAKEKMSRVIDEVMDKAGLSK